MPEIPEWRVRRERGSPQLLRLMVWISLHLGRRVSRCALYLISGYFVLFAPSAQRASRDYLQRLCGKKPGCRDVFRHMLAFASCVHDRVYLLNNQDSLFEVSVEGEALMREILDQGQGAFLFGAHLGSFEVIRTLGHRQPDLHIAMAMYQDNAQKINAMLALISPQLQLDIVALGGLDSMLVLRDKLEQGMMIGMLADRSISNEDVVSLPFLGAPASFPLGPFRLAAMLRSKVVFMAGLYLGENRYSIHFELLADFALTPSDQRDQAIAQAMQRYVALLQQTCQRAPYNWFNFYDFWPSKGHGDA